MRFLLILLTFLWTASALANTTCANGRQFIYLIHGIGGDSSTFGSMETYLNRLDKCFKAKSFSYKTGDSRFTTLDFAQSLHKYIEKDLSKVSLSSNDHISLIMHSQGGLVGGQWLDYLKRSKHSYLKNIDAFITLSTPYWGSSMALKGRRLFYTLPEDQDKNPISPFGKKELEEMSYGSATIKKVEAAYEEVFSLPGLRPLAIGGLKRGFNPYVGEDDMVVSAYSSRPDHYTLNDVAALNQYPTVTQADEFRRTNLVPFIPVRATHSNFDLAGVASIPEDCMYSPCAHPSLKYVVDHLYNRKITIPDSSKMFRKYRVQVFIENWQQFINSKNDITVEVVEPDGDDEDVDFNFRSRSEISASFTGVLDDYNEHEIMMTFKIRGKIIKTVRAPVQGGVLTFLRLSLN